VIINIIVTVITEHLFSHQSQFMIVVTVRLINTLIRNYDVLIVIMCDFVSCLHLTLTLSKLLLMLVFFLFSP